MNQIYNELLSLRKDGLIKPEDVVAFARDPNTALHSKFTWDDTKAAHDHRLWQARQVIVSVRIETPKSNQPFQAFVSINSDRTSTGGGYRETVAVLTDAQLREQLLSQAFEDFERWQQKYNDLVELANVFRAGRRARKQTSHTGAAAV